MTIKTPMFCPEEITTAHPEWAHKLASVMGERLKGKTVESCSCEIIPPGAPDALIMRFLFECKDCS